VGVFITTHTQIICSATVGKPLCWIFTAGEETKITDPNHRNDNKNSPLQKFFREFVTKVIVVNVVMFFFWNLLVILLFLFVVTNSCFVCLYMTKWLSLACSLLPDPHHPCRPLAKWPVTSPVLYILSS